jgi:hypothetical protein
MTLFTAGELVRRARGRETKRQQKSVRGRGRIPSILLNLYWNKS